MIKAIFLDLGRVLIDIDLNVAVRGLEKTTSWPLSDITRFLNGGLIREYELGRISTDIFHQTFCESLHASIPVEEFKTLWSQIFVAEPLLSESFLQALARNYPLNLLSNTNQLHYDFVVGRYPLLRYFKERILSYQVGLMKPQKEIYEVAIERSGVTAAEIFFTDDRPENVEGGLAAGIQAVQFLNEAQLKQDMHRVGIVF
jgi:putative hydrolase of the HAD superfamily